MRPNNWKNEYEDVVIIKIDTFEYRFSPHTIYEAGADAMLEGLFKMAKESPTGKFEIDSREVHIYSIPGEE